jgi:hypothetical protein
MTFGRKAANPDQRPTLKDLRRTTPPVAVDKTPDTEPDFDTDFDTDFDRQWVNAFDRKVGQRGSRRALELKAQEIDWEISDKLGESLSSDNFTSIAPASLPNTQAIKPSVLHILENNRREVFRNLWVTPISQLSVSNLSTLTQKQQCTNSKGSSQRSRGDSDDESNKDGQPSGNHVATVALGATTLIWLIDGEDGINRAYSKLKASKSKSTNSE